LEHMKNTGINCLLVVWILAAMPLQAQTALPAELAAAYREMPGELVYVHQNTGLLFSGETLYYKLYCLGRSTGKPSSISKIAYVAIVNREREVVFRQKLRLQDGTGQGDFLLPADIPTGSYKLLAYTQWMKNGNGAPVFSSDLMLINPYQEVPQDYLPENRADSITADSLAIQPAKILQRAIPSIPSGAEAFTATLNREVYGRRQKVELELLSPDADAPGGRYSISVRRIPDLKPPPPSDPLAFEELARTTEAPGAQKEEIFLPEIRGELISGKVQTASGSQPVANIPLALSLSGDDFIFDMARTDGQGRFYFNIDLDYEASSGIFQVLGNVKEEEYDLLLDPHSVPVPGPLEFYDFRLDPMLAAEIRDRSIRNQIENAYGEVKADTLVKVAQEIPFYRNFQQQIRLDDFTRFNTIMETLVEVVDHVWLDRDAQGDPLFQVRPFDGYLDGIGLPPMVFMDGLFIQNHEDIVSFPARRIKNIFISRDRYQLGANIFQGILAFETFGSDFADSFYRDFLKPETLFKPVPAKTYFYQEYNGSDEKTRIPDFRQQLYWNPGLEIVEAKTNIHWYTSDLPGTYEIRIQGYTATGHPVALHKTFIVE